MLTGWVSVEVLGSEYEEEFNLDTKEWRHRKKALLPMPISGHHLRRHVLFVISSDQWKPGRAPDAPTSKDPLE